MLPNPTQPRENSSGHEQSFRRKRIRSVSAIKDLMAAQDRSLHRFLVQ
jgi:hypothetical protein